MWAGRLNITSLSFYLLLYFRGLQVLSGRSGGGGGGQVLEIRAVRLLGVFERGEECGIWPVSSTGDLV